MTEKIETLINHKTVGEGKWPLEEIKKYCVAEGADLKRASYLKITYHSDGSICSMRKEHLDILTGEISWLSGSDGPAASHSKSCQ